MRVMEGHGESYESWKEKLGCSIDPRTPHSLVLTHVLSLVLIDLRHQSPAGYFLDGSRQHTSPDFPRTAQIHRFRCSVPPRIDEPGG